MHNRVTELLGASFAFGGRVAGRIGTVEPVADIIARTMREFGDVLGTAPSLRG